MKKKDLRKFLTENSPPGDASKIEGILNGLAMAGFSKGWKEVPPFEVALVLWAYAVSPYVMATRCRDWIRQQSFKMSFELQEGISASIPPFALGWLLTNPNELRKVVSVGIETQTGQISMLLKSGQTKTLCSYSAVDFSNLDGHQPKEVVLIPGAFLIALSKQIALKEWKDFDNKKELKQKLKKQAELIK